MNRFLLPFVMAVSPVGAWSQDVAEGARVFRDNCAACHGVSAKGDGPITSILTIQPADLTQIAAANGGVFPLESVVQQIDGDGELLAHGGSMPVFGEILKGDSGVIDASDGNPIFTPQAVVDVVAYLASIQD